MVTGGFEIESEANALPNSSDRSQLELEISAWEKQRNSQHASVNWRFQTTDARRKMERLYPNI